jgi:hypothetical protein
MLVSGSTANLLHQRLHIDFCCFSCVVNHAWFLAAVHVGKACCKTLSPGEMQNVAPPGAWGRRSSGVASVLLGLETQRRHLRRSPAQSVICLRITADCFAAGIELHN